MMFQHRIHHGRLFPPEELPANRLCLRRHDTAARALEQRPWKPHDSIRATFWGRKASRSTVWD